MSLVQQKTKHTRHSTQSKVDETAVKNKMDVGKKVASECKKENMPLVCPICDQNFKTKSNLKNHIDAVHKEKKSHTCSICEKSFSLKANLKNHVDAVHEGKKPHKCSICYRSFARKGQLKKHVNSVHCSKR